MQSRGCNVVKFRAGDEDEGEPTKRNLNEKDKYDEPLLVFFKTTRERISSAELASSVRAVAGFLFNRF